MAYDPGAIERMVEVTGPRVPDTQRASVIAGRLLALVLSLMWGVFGFGLIDLETALPPGHPGFREHWFLEGSWGFFVTALVIVPLLVVVLEPARASATVGQLHVVAACCAAAAVLCLDGTLFALPIALEVTAWAVWMSLRGLAKLVAQVAPTGGDTRQWWPFALVVGTYGVLPLLFGPDAYTVKVLGILAGVLGLAAWLAYAHAWHTEDGAAPDAVLADLDRGAGLSWRRGPGTRSAWPRLFGMGPAMRARWTASRRNAGSP